MAGFLKAQKGSIKIEPAALKTNFGFVFQNALLYEQASVSQNIYLSLKNAPWWKEKTTLNLIKKALQTTNLKKTKLIKSTESLQAILKKLATKPKAAWSSVTFLRAKLLLLKWHVFFFLVTKTKAKLSIAYQSLNFREVIKKEIQKIALELKLDKLLKQKAATLSGGERQRVAIAKALIKGAKLIFFDEPFAALDAKIKDKARQQLRQLQKKYAITMLFITHNQNDAMLISDFVVLMKEGKIVQSGSPSELFKKPQNLFVAQFIANPEINFLYQKGTYQYYLHPNQVRLKLNLQSPNIITNQETNGNLVFNYLWVEAWKRTIVAVTLEKKFPLHTKVEINYQESDLLVFDQQGNLVA